LALVGDVLELADRLWRGDADIADHHPVQNFQTEPEEVVDRVAFVASFANVSAVATEDGLVLVDTGSPFMAKPIHAALRTWTDQRLNTAVYSHGHIDHVFGVPVFEAEADEKGWPTPKVIAHEALPPRFDRYILTAGFNSIINQRQFRAPGLQWPTEYRYPDETYRDLHTFSVGGTTVELHHARGETDDHTWTWFPEHKVIGCGDFFIWASPNAGNPQKVQRYPKEWANALRDMLTKEPEILLPGHGLPIVGRDRVRAALTDAAALLDHLHDETLAMMNAGARLDEIIHSVQPPADLIEKPYLKPIYDEPEFIVRNVWRLYGGWYDGNPAHLKPAPEAALAHELATLAGGAAALAARAVELADAGDFRLASDLVELASLAAPDDKHVHAQRADVYERRAAQELSVMSRGIYSWAAGESRDRT
jgi:alkyl sulfatase BDS1-like metallo-beta-lactamase superfamily hydrolase